MPTNQLILKKGITLLAYALPLFFIGPSVVYMAFKNTKHFLYIPVLGLGIIFCVMAMYLFFKGIQIVMKSLFND